ncbi:disintegrin and metalloproteinase domain-containing protein 8 [Trichechus manatus latirostris]|uniref:Disintegrin and metalloproteinase domain-containing protein 8 n=1 Tax=Trichechus manatus latirostris TaxID=127582 RepID=A0A2Y9QX35_TRIMA|nr:disintegrin and metalloproteinase domain-containing protein 8 [Trichechus manatus latirostris]
MRGPGLGLGLWLPGALWLQVITSGPSLPHVDRFQVVWPWRLPTPRARRALSSRWSLYPESVSYVLGAGGHNFTLHLRKNRNLLGSGYTETYTAANGSEVVEQPRGQDHCLYQGHVEGHQGSAASISTCEGLRGFFRAGSAVHLIEPLDSAEEGRHALYQAQHLQQKRGTCGVSNASLEHILGPRIAAAFRPRDRPLSQEPRHVELYVVTDSTEFQQFGSQEALRRRVLEVVNHVDKLYQELGLRVALVGLEMWSRDKISVSPQADHTLENFLAWRKKDLVGRHAHDNAQLITGVDFSGTTVGLAKVASMCSQASAAVNQDHSQNPVGVASTMAHEMGHNLGMDHDENVHGCYCPVPRDSGGCVMAASIGLKFPRMFSQCSRADLETFVENPQTDCLLGTLDPHRLVSDPVCGNKFLERGEQCDCGSVQECQDPCCNASSCRLTEGAACAQGACCHKCQVKPAGELCRAPKDVCDLGEYCDGRQPECPEDVFQENGTPCLGGYCHNGVCPTLNQRCSDLWGPGMRAATETCFSYSLSRGCQGLHLSQVDPCGILYCQGAQKPLQRSYCTITLSFGHCQALVTEDGGAYETVPVGTRCGEGKVCWEGRCQGLHVYRYENCSAKCNGHGVCNHKSKCHCHPGWAPPDCAKPVSDVHTASGNLPMGVLVSVVLLVVVLLLVVGVIFYRKAWGHGRKRNTAPKTSTGLTNPMFHEKGSTAALGRSSAAAPTAGPPEAVSSTHSHQPPRPLVSTETPKWPRPVPPAAMSRPRFPVPVYTQQAPEQQLRPSPPNKPLPELKPKQVIRPTAAPPKPPAKPSAEGSTPFQAMKPTAAPPAPSTKLKPALTQGVGAKVALKPPVQRR